MRYFVKSLVSLQGVVKILNKNGTRSHDPAQCFFPQYALPYAQTPYFILYSAYDVYQLRHILVPPSADPHGHWYHCKLNPADLFNQILNLTDGHMDTATELLRFAPAKDPVQELDMISNEEQ